MLEVTHAGSTKTELSVVHPNQALRQRVESARNLPSPPAITAVLISLGENPDVTIEHLVDVLRADPALTARVIRLANSPLYALRQRAESLHHAVVLLGIDTVFTAALSLTLANSTDSWGTESPAFRACWTRSVHAATAAQVLARRIGCVAPGDAFLAGLIQDIGILAVHQIAPDTYEPLPSENVHDHFVRQELEMLGADHASIGSILLEAWRLPDHIVDAVARSHRGGEPGSDADLLPNVVAVGGLIADAISGDSDQLLAASCAAELLLGIDAVAFSHALQEIGASIHDLGPLLDASAPPITELTGMAEDALVLRQVRRETELRRLKAEVDGLTKTVLQLETAGRVDVTTGVFNRAHLDAIIEREYASALSDQTNLAMLFIDLDDFKRVNDVHGHHVGDQVLAWVGDRIRSTLRQGDSVGRYGGDEFVVVLPLTGDSGARVAASRLVSVFANSRIRIGAELDYRQSITVGVASIDHHLRFDSGADLVRAADEALMLAKQSGKGGFLAQVSR